MVTVEEVRESIPEAVREAFSDDVIMSPWFHVGRLEDAVNEDPRLLLSLRIIEDALRLRT